MHHRARLRRPDRLDGEGALAAKALLPRQRGCGAERFDRGEGSRLVPARLPRGLPRAYEKPLGLRRVAEPILPIPSAGVWSVGRAGEGRSTGPKVAVHDEVDEARPLRLVGVDGAARDAHRERFLEADKAWQPLRALGAGDDPEVHLRKAQARGRGRDAVVCGHRQLQAAPEGHPSERCDDRLGAVLDQAEEVVEVWRLDVVVAHRRLELQDVGAGHEGPPLSGDHDRLDSGVCSEPRDRGREVGAHGALEGVHRGIVDHDHRDAAIGRHPHPVRHVRPPRA